MHSDFVYRGYLIWHDGKETVCEEIGNDDEPLFQIGASSVAEAKAMVDEMYEALDQSFVPAWFSRWMSQPSVPIRSMARARLHPARNILTSLIPQGRNPSSAAPS